LQVTVRSTDIDLFGHVNNARYLHYLEWERLELLERLGLGLDRLEARGIVPVVGDLRIRYRHELRLGETVEVTVAPRGRRREVGFLTQEIRKEDGRLAARADLTFVFIDRTTRRSVPLPKEMAEWLEWSAP
jgi:thioesterase-3